MMAQFARYSGFGDEVKRRILMASRTNKRQLNPTLIFFDCIRFLFFIVCDNRVHLLFEQDILMSTLDMLSKYCLSLNYLKIIST